MLIKNDRKNTKHQDKLFHALVSNSDTIYLIYDLEKASIIYTTHNIEEVLGLKEVDYKKDVTNIVKDILNIPIIKDGLRSWDEKSEYVSGMVAYHNTAYQHIRWLKLKIYPFSEKKKKFHAILVSDATKEHDRQHMLVSQASDIKAREQKLNQIAAISYDVEITIQIGTGVFSIKNLKEISHYFGENRTGNTDDELKKIVENYIFEEDKQHIINEINRITSLKEDLSKGISLEPTSIKYRLNAKEEKWLESTLFYTKTSNGIFITILTKDVTENAEYVKKQNAILQKALEESKIANSSKDEFLAIMSHEIRTPMNVINGLSESILINGDELSKDIKEDIENINTASNNLIEIIDGLLDISKLKTGVVDLKEKEYDLAKFIKDLEAITKEKLKNKNVTLDVAVDPLMPSVLYGDVSKLRQVVLNILNNAVKYTLKGSIGVKIKWNGDKIAGKLAISISDTGIGIEKTKLASLLASSIKDDQAYVSGMGLYIAKKYIELLNGEITAESEVGKGSVFTVSINQKVIDDKAIGDIYSRSTTKKNVNTFNASDKRILIVDDDALNIKVASRLLKPYEVNIESVKSGKECIELLKKDQNFDLILLDQMMPEMSGTETLRKLKEENINIKTVMLTADAMVGKKELYLKVGFDDYISKPINTEQLNEILIKYLKGGIK